MDPNLQTVNMGYAVPLGSVEQRNRVLRNTYWLLALSMVPTILGAWIGVATLSLHLVAASLTRLSLLDHGVRGPARRALASHRCRSRRSGPCAASESSLSVFVTNVPTPGRAETNPSCSSSR